MARRGWKPNVFFVREPGCDGIDRHSYRLSNFVVLLCDPNHATQYNDNHDNNHYGSPHSPWPRARG